MLDPVRVSLPNNCETTCERDYAVALDLKILEDEPVIAHGRLRGLSRKGGRPMKPRTGRQSAIPTRKTAGKSASGTPGGVSAATPKEARK